MGAIHGFIGEKHFVGGDQRQVAGIGEIEQAAFDQPLACQSMTHELDIETPGKQLLQLAQLDCGRFILAFEYEKRPTLLRAIAETGALGLVLRGDDPEGVFAFTVPTDDLRGMLARMA